MVDKKPSGRQESYIGMVLSYVTTDCGYREKARTMFYRTCGHSRTLKIRASKRLSLKRVMSINRVLVRTDREFAITCLAAPGLDSSSILLVAYVLK